MAQYSFENETLVEASSSKPMGRADVYVRKTENLWAAAGVFFVLVGGTILIFNAWALLEIWIRRPTISKMLLAAAASPGLIFGLPAIYFGFLSIWRNTIDEWQASAEKRKLEAYALALEEAIELIQLEVAEAKREAQRYQDEAQQLRDRMNETISMRSKDGVTNVPKMTDVDAAILGWFREYLFGEGGDLIGAWADGGYIKCAFPFKSSSKDPIAHEARGRLERAGLIELRENNYYWKGPNNIYDATALIDGSSV